MKVQAYSEYAALLYAARHVGRPVQVVREPAGELSHRHPRPRRGAGGRARARRRRQIPRPARAHLCRHRRLHVDVRGDLCDRQHQELPLKRLRHSGDPHRREDGADQCGAARPLSRRRPAGGDLSDRAADRPGGAGDEHRSRGAAPAQLHPAVGDALQDAERADLRQRRIPDDPAKGADARRLERLFGAPQGIGAERKAARHRHRLLPRSRRRHSRRNRRSAVRTGRQGGVAHRRAGDGAGPSVDLRAAWWRRRLGIDPAVRAARRGRQRRGAGRHAERGIALDHDGGQRHRARLRPRHRKGPARRRALFEADADDIEFADGAFRVAGTDRTISILDLARACASRQCRRTCRAGSTTSRNSCPRR